MSANTIYVVALSYVATQLMWWRRERTPFEKTVYVRCHSCDHLAELRPVHRITVREMPGARECAVAILLAMLWWPAFKRLFWVYPALQLMSWMWRRRTVGATCSKCGSDSTRPATREEYERLMMMSPHR